VQDAEDVLLAIRCVSFIHRAAGANLAGLYGGMPVANEWISQKLVSKAAAASTIYNNAVKHNFGWWFAYFWKEVGAKGRDDDMLKTVLAKVFASQFPANVAGLSFVQKRAEGDRVAAAFNAPLPEPADLMTNAAYYRQMLTEVLRLGFRGMPMAEKVAGPGLDHHQERRAALAAMFADRVEVDNHGTRIPIALAYRGETREFAKVIEHQGALSRADLGLLNMNKPWHPFSDPVVAAEVYARGASGDNCLYTVLSIATEVAIPVGFPLTEDENIYRLPNLPNNNISDLTYKTYREMQPPSTGDLLPIKLAKCRISGIPNKSSGIFMATDSFIYVVKVKKAAFTQDFVEQEFAMPQNQCKERGVRGVKLKNFLAGARIRRVHLGHARMCGVVGFVQEVRYFVNGLWVPNPNIPAYAADHFYGDQPAATACLDFIRQRLGPSGGGMKIDGEIDGDMAPNPRPTILALEQWDLSFNEMNAYKNNNLNQIYWGRTD
jgi:hypothetical protein